MDQLKYIKTDSALQFKEPERSSSLKLIDQII